MLRYYSNERGNRIGIEWSRPGPNRMSIDGFLSLSLSFFFPFSIYLLQKKQRGNETTRTFKATNLKSLTYTQPRKFTDEMYLSPLNRHTGLLLLLYTYDLM